MPQPSPTLLHILHGIGVLFAVIAFCLMLMLERREFRRHDRAAGWVRLRLALLPIAAVTAAVVFVPARVIKGPEALAVFYVGVLITGPLTWFGLHWLFGRWFAGLTRAESMQLGAYPIGLALLLVALAHMAQPWVWQFALHLRKTEYANAIVEPAPHTLSQARRYDTPDGSFTSSYWQSREATKIERIDKVTAQSTHEGAERGASDICQEANGIRWLRDAEAPAATLLVYWRDAEQRLHRSELPAPTRFTPAAFAVQWTDDPQTFVLPEAFPRHGIQIGHAPPDRDILYSNTELLSFAPGEDFSINCVPAGWRSRHRVDAVMLLIPRTYPTPPLMIRALRQVSADTAKVGAGETGVSQSTALRP